MLLSWLCCPGAVELLQSIVFDRPSHHCLLSAGHCSLHCRCLQVFTAVLMHYTRDQLPFTMFADSKVPNDIWGKNNGELRGGSMGAGGRLLSVHEKSVCR